MSTESRCAVLLLLAGEAEQLEAKGQFSRRLDQRAAELLGWRVSRDPYWNEPGNNPPGDEYCIRRDGRCDVPCNEGLPYFSSSTLRRLSSELLRPEDLPLVTPRI